MKNTKERDRRIWILLLLVVPVGIGCMLFAGQTAIRMIPRWSMNTNMDSNLNPASYNQQVGLVEPINPDILTPADWGGNYLTPHPGGGSSGTVVPFVVFTETTTPTATTVTPTDEVTATETATATPTAPTVIPPTATPTKPKGGGGGGGGGPTATVSPSPSPSPSPSVTSTVDPTDEIPVPADVNTGDPDNVYADGTEFLDGTYFVIDLGANPVNQVNVAPTPDGNYDLVYYEVPIAGPTPHSDMDQIIIGLSNSPDGNPYYEVFNWGDNAPDENSNVDITNLPAPPPGGQPEADNLSVDATNLYDPGPPAQGTGILIDVDQNTNGNPPPGDYRYVVVIAPVVPAQSPPDPSGDSSGQLDAVDLVEVPIP